MSKRLTTHKTSYYSTIGRPRLHYKDEATDLVQAVTDCIEFLREHSEAE